MATTKKKTANAGKGENDSRLLKFFKDELKDIYWAEKHIVTTLPKTKKAATLPDLQQGFEEHLEQTKGHVARLEKALKFLEKELA